MFRPVTRGGFGWWMRVSKRFNSGLDVNGHRSGGTRALARQGFETVTQSAPLTDCEGKLLASMRFDNRSRNGSRSTTGQLKAM